MVVEFLLIIYVVQSTRFTRQACIFIFEMHLVSYEIYIVFQLYNKMVLNFAISTIKKAKKIYK